MKRKHQRTLELLFSRPTSANIHWRDIEGLLAELGAEITEREGAGWRLCCLAKYGSFTGRTPHRIQTKVLSPAFANG
jgi:hypothetical protein